MPACCLPLLIQRAGVPGAWRGSNVHQWAANYHAELSGTDGQPLTVLDTHTHTVHTRLCLCTHTSNTWHTFFTQKPKQLCRVHQHQSCFLSFWGNSNCQVSSQVPSPVGHVHVRSQVKQEIDNVFSFNLLWIYCTAEYKSKKQNKQTNKKTDTTRD